MVNPKQTNTNTAYKGRLDCKGEASLTWRCHQQIS